MMKAMKGASGSGMGEIVGGQTDKAMRQVQLGRLGRVGASALLTLVETWCLSSLT